MITYGLVHIKDIVVITYEIGNLHAACYLYLAIAYPLPCFAYYSYCYMLILLDSSSMLWWLVHGYHTRMYNYRSWDQCIEMKSLLKHGITRCSSSMLRVSCIEMTWLLIHWENCRHFVYAPRWVSFFYDTPLH